MKSLLPIRLLLLGVAVHVACAVPASAHLPQTRQTPRARPQTPVVKPDSTAGSPGSPGSLPPIRLPNKGPSITDKLPYTQWTRHLGPAADALVTAEVALRDDKTRAITTQTGVGIIVRCDGLVLLPACLFYTPGNADRTRRESVMSVTLHAQTVQGKDIPAAFTADVPRYRSPKAAFVLVKTREIRDRHFRAAALLHPKNLSATRSVSLHFPQRDINTSGSTLTVETAKVQVTEKPDGPATLTFVSTGGTPAPKLPPGAIVIDNESKMAIGIYAPPDVSPGEAAAPAAESDLTTFARLHEVSNAFGLVPQPDDRLSDAPSARKPGEVQEGMVWIPGGPREIRPTEWQELQGAIVACGPGFWIDRTEVTVGEYRKFLAATKYRPLPKGWSEGDALPVAANPSSPVSPVSPGDGEGEIDPASLPVRGVTAADAEAYAAWAGKRLVTPIEWAWATVGAGLAPAEPVTFRQYNGFWKDLAEHGSRIDAKRTNDWVARDAPPWLSAYERVLSDAETMIRSTTLLAAYTESKFWEWWQSPVKSRMGRIAEMSFLYGKNPTFLAAINYVTPSRAVADPAYVTPVLNEEVGAGGLHGFTIVPSRLISIEDAQSLVIKMFNPLPIAPVGSRRYDRSIYDVRDIGTNLPEWIQENRALRPEEQVEKPLPPLFDPVQQPDWRQVFDAEVTRRVTAMNVGLNGGDRFNFSAVQSNLVFPRGETASRGGRLGPIGTSISPTFSGAGNDHIDAAATLQRAAARFPAPLLPFLSLSRPNATPDFGTGFRCAR